MKKYLLLGILLLALFVVWFRQIQFYKEKIAYLEGNIAYTESQVKSLINVSNTMIRGGSKFEIVESADQGSLYRPSMEFQLHTREELELKSCIYISGIRFVFDSNHKITSIDDNICHE